VVVVFPAPLTTAQLYENIFSLEDPIIIRTLPQYSEYHGLYYNDLLKGIKSGKQLTNGQIIKMGKEYRVLCTE